jgi:SAM-dependent methyltransferase
MEKKILEDPLEILDRKEVVLVLKKHWEANHENLAEPEKFVEEFFAYLLEKRDLDALDVKEIKKFYNKKLKEHWRDGKNAEKPRDMFLEIIDGNLDGVKTVLDFGCGKLAFLKELAEGNKKIEKLIGVDLKSQPVLDGLDPRIEFRRSLMGVEKETVDLAVIKLVLHHLESDEEILEIFKNIKNILRPGGRLIIFEESFPKSCHSELDSESKELFVEKAEILKQVQDDMLRNIKKYLRKFNMEPSEVTEDFLQLPEEDKIYFLFLNDWLMNVQNSYMPWTGQYKSMEGWKKLGEAAGFAEKESHFLGAIKHRKRKQGMTAYMVWEK